MKGLLIEDVNLPLNNLGMIVAVELLTELFPSRIRLRKREGAKLGFLIGQFGLNSYRPPCGCGINSNAHFVRNPNADEGHFSCAKPRRWNDLKAARPLLDGEHVEKRGLVQFA